MKRMLTILLVFMLTLSGCTFYTQVYTNETEPDRTEYQIVKETKQVIQEINIQHNDGRTEQVIYNYERFKDHLPPYSAEFYENDQSVRVEQYIWDEQQNLTAIMTEGTESITFELTYDELNRVTEKRIFSGAAEIGKENYSYDEAGRLMQTCVYESDSLVSSTVTTFDDSGKRNTVTVSDGQGNIVSRQECSYDEKKYQETILEYDGSGVLQRRIINGYNIGNVVVAQEIYDAQDNLLCTTYWRYSTYSTSRLEPAA